MLHTSFLPRLFLPRSIQVARLLFGFVIVFAAAQTAQAQSANDGFDPNANGTVRVVVVQPDGKTLIAGDFTTVSPTGGGAVTRNHIARMNPNGTLDTAFNPRTGCR